MSIINKCLVSKESGTLQIPYADYMAIMAKVQEGLHMRQVRDEVVAGLQGFLSGEHSAEEVAQKIEKARSDVAAPKQERPEVVAPEGDKPQAKKVQEANARPVAKGIEIPPIKKDISGHFNKQDESGRLLSVFQQYYSCMNDSCGGTVRVTMKDGFCSLWNYDEWEEFAFVDIFEGALRIAVDPRYTDALQALSLCEVPRLLSSRRDLVCVKVDDLSNTMLEVLVKAFEEVGTTAG